VLTSEMKIQCYWILFS